jgi:hypothetical protein
MQSSLYPCFRISYQSNRVILRRLHLDCTELITPYRDATYNAKDGVCEHKSHTVCVFGNCTGGVIHTKETLRIVLEPISSGCEKAEILEFHSYMCLALLQMFLSIRSVAEILSIMSPVWMGPVVFVSTTRFLSPEVCAICRHIR